MKVHTVGQTKKAGIQAGARRTFAVGARRLWLVVVSPRGQELLGRNSGGIDAGAPGVTTLVEGSHYRQKIPVAGGAATLQVRVIAADAGRATLALHVEKLTDPGQREAFLQAFQAGLERLGKELEG